MRVVATVSRSYYKRYPHSFIDATIGMSLEDKGALSVLLDLIQVSDGLVQDDARYIAGHLGCSVRKWGQIRRRLLSSGHIHIEAGQVASVMIYTWQVISRRGEPRRAIPLSVKVLVKEKSFGQCFYCQDPIGPFEIDHVVPVSKGGGDELENLVYACRSCNRSKGSMSLKEWIGRE